MNSLETLVNELLDAKVLQVVTDPETNLVTEVRRRPANSLEIRAAKAIVSLHNEIQLLINKNAENRSDL